MKSFHCNIFYLSDDKYSTYFANIKFRSLQLMRAGSCQSSFVSVMFNTKTSHTLTSQIVTDTYDGQVFSWIINDFGRFTIFNLDEYILNIRG